MLTNAQKATAYREMGDRIAKGWVKGNYREYTTNSVCMIGAARHGVRSLHGVRNLKDMENVLRKDFSQRHPLYRVFKYDVESWNDILWRRRGAVVRFMRAQQRKYERLARRDFGTRVKNLEARVLHLEQITILTSHPDLIELQKTKAELEKTLG